MIFDVVVMNFVQQSEDKKSYHHHCDVELLPMMTMEGCYCYSLTIYDGDASCCCRR